MGKNEEQPFEFVVQEDGGLKMEMTGSGDADIYLRVGSAPTTDAYDLRPYADNSNESGSLAVKKGDRIFGMVRGYSDRADYDVNITME